MSKIILEMVASANSMGPRVARELNEVTEWLAELALSISKMHLRNRGGGGSDRVCENVGHKFLHEGARAGGSKQSGSRWASHRYDSTEDGEGYEVVSTS
jgi:hypothetical protein